MDFTQYKYINGQWTWNDENNKLIFVSNDTQETGVSQLNMKMKQTTSISKTTSGISHNYLVIKFRDSLDPLETIRFRRHYRRKVDEDEPDIVIIQDIRDVVLFSIPIKQLSVRYVKYFHTESMDFLLRSLIIYFQYFIQVWEFLQERRIESEIKIYQPEVLAKENAIRDDLADLRAMVSRAYLIFICGADDTKSFHHLHSTRSECSDAEKDVRFFEFLYQVCTQVVWIALLKRNRNLIEMEVNRMFRTNSYNLIARKSGFNTNYLKSEKRILFGKSNVDEMKLLQRSLVGKEIFLENHDLRMLAIGHVEFENADERIKYLEIAYTAPEELLPKLDVPVGILGYPRSDFNATLTLKNEKNDDGSVKIWPKMVIPPKQKINLSDLPYNYPTKPCKYSKTREQREVIKSQCQNWINYVENRRSTHPSDARHYSEIE